MSAFTELPGFQPLALFASLLVLKMGAVAFITAKNRAGAKIVVNPEDQKVTPGSHVEGQDAPDVLRAKRAHMNDLENIPAFLFIATLLTLAGGSSTALWAYGGVYFVARTLHTTFYLNGVQPWRTAMFALGQLTLVGAIVNLLIAAF